MAGGLEKGPRPFFVLLRLYAFRIGHMTPLKPEKMSHLTNIQTLLVPTYLKGYSYGAEV